jgi:hypothetical protein
MTNPAHAILPDVLEALLHADADFARHLLEAAPLPEGNARAPDYLELMTRYEKYMPSSEVTAIARFLYMLDAYGVTSEEALRRLIASHNEHMAELAADSAHLIRMGVPKKRLLEARFPKGAEDAAVMNFTYHRQVALDATAMGRFLVEFANRHQISEAMNLLAELGFFRVIPSVHAAKIYLSDGRLESIYREYLTQVAQGVGRAFAGQDRLPETQ